MYMSYAPSQAADYGQSLLSLLAQAHRALELSSAISAQLKLTPNTARAAGLQDLAGVLPRISGHIDTAMGAARLAAAGYQTPLVHGVLATCLVHATELMNPMRAALQRLQQAPGVEEVIAATSAWADLLPTTLQQATDLVRGALGQENWQRLVTGEAFRGAETLPPSGRSAAAEPAQAQGVMESAPTEQRQQINAAQRLRSLLPPSSEQ